MGTRKRGNSTTGGRAKRSRLEPELGEASDVTSLMNYFEQKFGEVMHRMDRYDSASSGASLASATMIEMGALTTRNSEPSTSTKEPEVTTTRDGESSMTARPIKAVSKTKNVFVMKPVMEQPKFNGSKGQDPVRFIDRLKRYIECVEAGDKAIEIALECLSGPPQKFMESQKKQWTNLVDFTKDFLDMYWGEYEQEEAKDKLMNTIWTPNKGLTMQEHYSEQLDGVSQFTIPLTESDLVKIIMRQYPEDIQWFWLAKGCPLTTLQTVRFLKDMEKRVKSHRGQKEIIPQRFDHQEVNRESNRQPYYNQRGSNAPEKAMNNNAVGYSYGGRGRGGLQDTPRRGGWQGVQVNAINRTNWVNGGINKPAESPVNQNEKIKQAENKEKSGNESENQGN